MPCSCRSRRSCRTSCCCENDCDICFSTFYEIENLNKFNINGYVCSGYSLNGMPKGKFLNLAQIRLFFG